VSVEAAALGAGKAVAKIAASKWLESRSARAAAGADLIDLIKVGFPDEIMQRKAQSKFDDLIASVAEHLRPYIRTELRGLTDNDREAALRAVAATLNQADFSDEKLFADDVDPLRLAERVRAALPRWDAERELGESGARLYTVAVAACCDCLAHILKHLPEFAERAAGESLARLTRAIASLDEILSRLPVRTLDAPQGESLDGEFTRRYLERVSAELDRLELFGVRFDRLTRPRTTLSVAYISLNVTNENPGKSPSWLASTSEWSDERSYRGTARAENALAEHRLMLIRGEAGSGKSTLLRWLAITAARGLFSGALTSLNGSVPFLIKLRSYTDRPLPRSDEFIDDVAPALGAITPDAWAHRCLESGRAMLLIDGIDEIVEAQREKVRSWLRNLTDTYPRARVVVTSRPAAVAAGWLGAEEFQSAFLEPLTPGDLAELIRHWHMAIRDSGDLPCPPERLPGYEARLLARLEATAHLRALATTPLLAAMLCALNLDRDSLPRDRMGLYADVIDMLLETRDAKRDIPSAKVVRLERKQKRRLLRDLAWHLSTNDLVELSRSTAQRLLAERLESMAYVKATGEEALEALLQRSGIIHEPVPDEIDFVHRTIQEYLTAERAADLDTMNLLVQAADLDHWREVIIMAIGHANETQRRDLIQGILGRTRERIAPERARQLKLLAVGCMETLPAVSGDLQEALDECLDGLFPVKDADEASSLAALGEPVLRRLPASLERLPGYAAAATVRTAWLINGPDALNLLQGYASDERREVQDELNLAWAYFDPDEYAERVISAMPGWSRKSFEVHLPAQFALLNKVPPLWSLRVHVVGLNDWSILSVHSASLRELGLTGSRLDAAALTSLVDAVPNVRWLYLHRCDGINDLTPLRNLLDLERLYIDHIPPGTDLSPLAQHERLKSVLIGRGRDVRGAEPGSTGKNSRLCRQLNEKVPSELG